MSAQSAEIPDRSRGQDISDSAISKGGQGPLVEFPTALAVGTFHTPDLRSPASGPPGASLPHRVGPPELYAPPPSGSPWEEGKSVLDGPPRRRGCTPLGMSSADIPDPDPAGAGCGGGDARPRRPPKFLGEFRGPPGGFAAASLGWALRLKAKSRKARSRASFYPTPQKPLRDANPLCGGAWRLRRRGIGIWDGTRDDPLRCRRRARSRPPPGPLRSGP